MKKKYLVISIILASYFIIHFSAAAQFNLGGFNSSGPSSLADEMSVDLIPTYPKPNSQVFVNLRMYTEDLNSAMIRWLVDGKVVKEGRGLISFNFAVGGAGSKTELKINITLQSGISFSKSITLRPAGLDLIWQSDSYVPPFYKGKALFPQQGDVVILAIPQFNSGISQIDLSRLVYKWTVNDEVLESQSGYGRSAIFTSGPILGTSMEVEVLVTDPTTNLVAENFMTIDPVNPIVAFYENSPLYGIIFEKVINSGFNLQGEEVNILAVPFFMNVRDSVFYSWSMNGQEAPSISGLSVIFRKPEGVSGSTFLSLKAENQKRILQFTESGFNINYKNE